MFVVLKLDRRTLQHAPSLDVHLVVVVDQDVRNTGILHQRFKRAKAEYLVQDFLDDAVPLRQRHRNVFLEQQLFHGLTDLAPQPFLADQAQRFAVQRLKQLAVNFRFQFGMTLGIARPGRDKSHGVTASLPLPVVRSDLVSWRNRGMNAPVLHCRASPRGVLREWPASLPDICWERPSKAERPAFAATDPD